MTQRLREEERTWRKVMSSEWGMSSRGRWRVPLSGPGLQPPRCPLCPQGRRLPGSGGLWAGCCFVSPSLPPEQISASGSFHRVAFPTRPSVFFQFACTLWIIVFFRLFLKGDDLVHASPSSPACELHQDRDHVFLILMSTEPRTF